MEEGLGGGGTGCLLHWLVLWGWDAFSVSSQWAWVPVTLFWNLVHIRVLSREAPQWIGSSSDWGVGRRVTAQHGLAPRWQEGWKGVLNKSLGPL